MRRAHFLGRVVMDGGAGGHVLPPYTAQELRDHGVTDWHLLCATPIGDARRDFPGSDDLGTYEEAHAAFQLFMASQMDADVAHARKIATAEGIRLHVWAPRSWAAIGPKPFVASPELIRARFREGAAVVAESIRVH